MLQRAASNAYSWWWASHIRTKQSKWMEHNLQDMEEKVQNALKLIEEDGDSFARRAEMYYKKRPELINFVEESYRAYRALAERYDHISTELQNANNTIASVFPEQVQFAMDEEDEEAMPKVSKKQPEILKTNIPKVPSAPITDLKSVITSATKKLKSKKTSKPATAVPSVAKSGLSKPEALHEIDKNQKQILTLQTEKEFLKSSYESGLAKYWEIENQIKDIQERVLTLQDEFGEGMVIEDDEARNLMAKSALNSCQASLYQLQEKQERSAEEAKVEATRIREVREKLESLKGQFHGDEVNPEKSQADKEPPRQEELTNSLNQEVENNQRAVELRQKIKEHLESNTCLTVTEMAEKIDELVNKVINLETALSSQTALMTQLRSETDDLQSQIQTLEDDRASIIDGKNNLQQKLEEMEEKLRGIQDLNQKVENENSNLQTYFIEAHCNLDHLSEKLPSIELDEEIDPSSSLSTMASEKLPSAEFGASGPHTELKQPDEELEAHLSSNDLKQMRSDEACQGQNEEPIIEMSTQKYLSPKEESLHLEEEFEKADASGSTRNQVDDGQTQENSLHLERDCTKSDINSSVGNQVEVVESRDNSPLEDNYEKPDLNDAAKSQEDIVQTQDNSINMEGNSEKIEIDSSARNQIEVVQTEHNSQYSECSSEKHHESSTPRTEVEENYEEANLEHPLERNKDVKEQDKEEKMTSEQTFGALPNTEHEEQVMEKEDELNWRELFLSGMEHREKLLLTEYTTTLRNFKDVKKKLNEMDLKNRDHQLQTTKQVNELKSANALKNEEIRSLRHKLNLMQKCFYESKESMDLNQKTFTASDEISISKEETDDLSKLLVHQPVITSVIEDRLRLKIDELLEENLGFWLKFSTSFHQIQKFDTEIQDLKLEVSKLQEENGKKQDESSSSSSTKFSLKSEARPLYKHLREKQTQLTVWSDKSTTLKDELQSRFSSLCNIQEEITAGLKASAEDDDFTFTSYQAAKFQGEVLNMKQENNKVADELQAALDHVATLQNEVENTLSKLNEEFRLSGSKKQENPPQLRHSESRNRVPLRSFIFGIKQKKQRSSIFSGMAPVMHRKYYGLRTGPPSPM